MPEVELTFGGLRSLEYDERVDIDHALTCTDCHVDYGGVQPRNGYRSATATPPQNVVIQALTNHTITPENEAAFSIAIPTPPTGFWYSQAYWIAESSGAGLTSTGQNDRIYCNVLAVYINIAQRVNGSYSGTAAPDGTYYGAPPSGPTEVGELDWILEKMQASSNYSSNYYVQSTDTNGTVTVNLWLVLQTVPILSTSTVTVGATNHVVASGATYSPTWVPPAAPAGQYWVRVYATVTGTTTAAATDVLTCAVGGNQNAYNVAHGSSTISFSGDFFDNYLASAFAAVRTDAYYSQTETLSYKNNSTGNETITLTVTLESAVIPAYASADPQGVWRHRPTSTSETAVVNGGTIYLVSDPSAEVNQDGTFSVPTGQVGFQPTANISGCQLGKYLYLGSDQTTDNWQRVNSGFTVETIQAIQPGATPTVSYSTLSVTKFNPSGVTMTNALVGCTIATIFTDWVEVTPSTTPNTCTFNLGAQANWSAYGWVAVMLTPCDGNAGNNTVAILISSSAGSGFEQVGVINDTPGTDTPFVVYVPLTGVTSATIAAVQYIQFTSNNTSTYAVYGFMLVPTAPATGIQQYFLDAYSSTTSETSGLFPPLNADGSGGISVSFIQNNIVIPTFHGVSQHEGTYYDAGTNSLDPQVLVNNPARFYNASQPTAYPTRGQFASVPTFSGTAPAGNYNQIRLWRLTSTGIRLVVATNVTPGNAYTITDSEGIYTLQNQLYIPGGPPPQCTTMASLDARIICGGNPASPQTFYVSSFLPFGATSDPYPQFPAVPTLITDGWNADIASTNAEGIVSIVAGDNRAYILSNEACYILTSLDAPLYAAPPFDKIWARGAIGRQAAIWAEDCLYWAAHDGVYFARNRSFGGELTETVNRKYRTQLLPDSTTVLGYQDRKLLVTRGNLQMRYDFVTSTWSGPHTLGNTMLFFAGWHDPGAIYQQAWFLGNDGNLYRWQPGTYWADSNRATSDNGATIPNWVYRTGYDVKQTRSMMEGVGDFSSRVKRVWTDTDGAVSIAIYKDASVSRSNFTSTSAGSHEYMCPPDFRAFIFGLQFSGSPTTRLMRALWEREKVAGRGGGSAS